MKRNFFVLVTLMFIILFSSAHAQKNKQQILESLFINNGEIYFSFQIFDRDEIGVLTRIISIDNVKDHDVYAYANRNEFSRFLDLGYSYTVLPHPGTLLSESELNMGGNQRKPQTGTLWNFYPTYDQYVAYMEAFAADYPDICRLDTIGTSVQGRLLLAVKLSDSVNVKRAKPEFFYTSSMHGDEVCGYIMMMHLIDSLLTGYGTVNRITNLLNNFQIYINPLANPDGTYHGGNNSVYGAQRYNANGYDLNRNFPDPAAGPNPGGPWQPETKAFMHYDTIHHFVMSANFHGGAEVVNYPWDTWAKLHADDSWMQFVSHEFADTVHLNSPYGYFTYPYASGVTNGYAWYTITGGRQDYTTYFHYGREVTIELSITKILPTNQLISHWEYLKRSFLNYIEESGYGIHGQVTDTATGTPVRAKVSIFLHDFDNSFQYSDSVSGWYYRPIAQGNWSLTFTSPGYYPKTIGGITVSNRTTTPLNVRMIPIGFGIQNETQKTSAIVFPNPSNGNIHLLLPEIGTSFIYSIFDRTGRLIQSGTIDGAGDKVVYDLDLKPFGKGIYLLKLEGGKAIYENKVIIN